MSASNGTSKYAPVPGTIPGIDVILSGVKLTLAAVNVNQAIALREPLKQLAGVAPDDLAAQMDAGIPVIFAAAVRNHPDITEQDVRELVDLSNFEAALRAAMHVGGYEKGEDKAGTKRTGTPSSPTSRSLPAGPGNTAASS